jgi:hypothetical protein
MQEERIAVPPDEAPLTAAFTSRLWKGGRCDHRH